MEDDKKGQELLNHLLVEYAPLIRLHAHKLKNEGLIPESIDVNDLHVEGYKGLVDALQKYQHNPSISPGSKNPFAAYAKSRIRGKMLDHISSHDSVPKHMRYKAKQLGLKHATEQAPKVETPVAAPVAATPKPPKT